MVNWWAANGADGWKECLSSFSPDSIFNITRPSTCRPWLPCWGTFHHHLHWVIFEHSSTYGYSCNLCSLQVNKDTQKWMCIYIYGFKKYNTRLLKPAETLETMALVSILLINLVTGEHLICILSVGKFSSLYIQKILTFDISSKLFFKD